MFCTLKALHYWWSWQIAKLEEKLIRKLESRNRLDKLDLKIHLRGLVYKREMKQTYSADDDFTWADVENDIEASMHEVRMIENELSALQALANENALRQRVLRNKLQCQLKNSSGAVQTRFLFKIENNTMVNDQHG